jgi:hypothetical protein
MKSDKCPFCNHAPLQTIPLRTVSLLDEAPKNIPKAAMLQTALKQMREQRKMQMDQLACTMRIFAQPYLRRWTDKKRHEKNSARVLKLRQKYALKTIGRVVREYMDESERPKLLFGYPISVHEKIHQWVYEIFGPQLVSAISDNRVAISSVKVAALLICGGEIPTGFVPIDTIILHVRMRLNDDIHDRDTYIRSTVERWSKEWNIITSGRKIVMIVRTHPCQYDVPFTAAHNLVYSGSIFWINNHFPTDAHWFVNKYVYLCVRHGKEKEEQREHDAYWENKGIVTVPVKEKEDDNRNTVLSEAKKTCFENVEYMVVLSKVMS